MKMIPIAKSSNVSHVGYENGSLAVQFHDGGLYHYSDVPQDIYLRLLSAPSKGSFLHKVVKPKFKATNMKPTPIDLG
jgi:hypothetical protein